MMKTIRENFGLGAAAMFALFIAFCLGMMIKEAIWGPWTICTKSHQEQRIDDRVFIYIPMAEYDHSLKTVITVLKPFPNPRRGEKYYVTVCDYTKVTTDWEEAKRYR
jgi:hypothetical protein